MLHFVGYREPITNGLQKTGAIFIGDGLLLLSMASFQTVSAATAPSLGTAASFAVLGARQ